MPQQHYDDFSTLQHSVEFISEKIDELLKRKIEINQILAVVSKVHKAIKIKDKKIEELENRIDDLEQCSLKYKIIISGLTTHNKTWALQASPLELCIKGIHAPEQELETLESEVLSFMNLKLGTNIKSTDVSACHTLVKGKQPGKLYYHNHNDTRNFIESLDSHVLINLPVL